ncbi:MAG: hypothetical protein QGH54_13915 [SAR202 cluster bacterium]|nr:hypothetical protein [SAR202 cluster bacterium]
MGSNDDVLIDPDVKLALDGGLLSKAGVTSSSLYGGVGYLIDDRPFAVLLEGVVGMQLPEDLHRQATSLAGVSPLRPPFADDAVPGWLQFMLLLPDDLPEVMPWIEAALENVR